MIAYSDANFSEQRSQTGCVIKLGVNVITWRSMKQSTVSASTTESEVQALASTEKFADLQDATRVVLPEDHQCGN